MAEANERRRVLDLLASRQITADQAAELLEAMGTSETQTHARPSRGPTRVLRISVDACDEDGESTKVAINVPIALARFASRMIPEEVRLQLEDRGVELSGLLEALDGELPEGPLLDIDANDAEGSSARILVEVVR